MKYVTNLPNMRVQHILIGHPARFYWLNLIDKLLVL
jgi:hypothetical protein